MAAVLLVEDDAGIRTMLEESLRRRGHRVLGVGTARAAVSRALESMPDVVVLDLGLPDLDGSTVVETLRAVSSVPIIVATARQSERDTVALLRRGADDYLVKPFSADHLDARIRAVLRRSGNPEDEPVLRVGELVIDRAARTATLAARPLPLSRMEFDLLVYLAARAGRVVPKHQIMSDVWHQPYGGADKTVEVHLSWLRRKLGETAAEPRYLHTVRGVGVRLAEPG